MVCYQIVMMNCIFQRVIICYLTLAIVIFTCQTRLRSLHKYTHTPTDYQPMNVVWRFYKFN